MTPQHKDELKDVFVEC